MTGQDVFDMVNEVLRDPSVKPKIREAIIGNVGTLPSGWSNPDDVTEGVGSDEPPHEAPEN